MDNKAKREELERMKAEVDEVQSLIDRIRRLGNLPKNIELQVDEHQVRVNLNRRLINFMENELKSDQKE